MIQSVVQDVRVATRTLWKAPTFTAAVVATIGLAVGAVTAIFTVVNAVVLRPLPFPGSEKAVMLCETNPVVGDWCGASPMNVGDWARLSRSLDSVGVVRMESSIGEIDGEKQAIRGALVTPGFFRALRTRPAIGRLLRDEDMNHGSNHVVVLSHAFWLEKFSADPAVVGRQIVLDREPFTIVGVLAADAYAPAPYGSRVQAWKPITTSVDNVEQRNWRGFAAVGRAADGVSREALAAEMETIRGRLAQAYPEANKNWGLRIVSLRKQVVGDVGWMLWMFLGGVGCVLLVACANVASLLLVRASGRTSEFAVRAALGARRYRLAQQLVIESLVLSLAGGLVGLLLARWATSAFLAVAPRIPRLEEVSMDGRVVAFTLLLSIATALIFGLAPARVGSRTDVSSLLRGRRGAGSAGAGVRSALVVVEVALALMLLVSAGLLVRSFGRLVAWDPGFDRSGLVISWMLPPRSDSGAATVALMERVRDEVATLPGVRAVALGSGGPLFEGGDSGGLAIEGRAPFSAAQMPAIDWFDVSPHYFDTLGVRLVRGRQLTEHDLMSTPHVAIVNETFARRFFGGSNALGQRVTVENHPSEIVGIVADVKPLRPDEPTRPKIYWPIAQYRRGAAYLIVRTTPNVPGPEKAVKARVASVNADIRLSTFETLDEDLASELVKPRFNMLLVASFALVAVLVAAVGVYAVIAFAVASRTREIGIRVALGAVPSRVVASHMRRGLALTAIGLLLGLAGALVVGRLLSSLLYGVPPTDPVAVLSALALFTLVAAGACWLPARRASRVDPTVALRTE